MGISWLDLLLVNFFLIVAWMSPSVTKVHGCWMDGSPLETQVVPIYDGSMYVYIHICTCTHIYIYICVCVCLCICIFEWHGVFESTVYVPADNI